MKQVTQTEIGIAEQSKTLLQIDAKKYRREQAERKRLEVCDVCDSDKHVFFDNGLYLCSKCLR